MGGWGFEVVGGRTISRDEKITLKSYNWNDMTYWCIFINDKYYPFIKRKENFGEIHYAWVYFLFCVMFFRNTFRFNTMFPFLSHFSFIGFIVYPNIGYLRVFLDDMILNAFDHKFLACVVVSLFSSMVIQCIVYDYLSI